MNKDNVGWGFEIAYDESENVSMFKVGEPRGGLAYYYSRVADELGEVFPLEVEQWKQEVCEALPDEIIVSGSGAVIGYVQNGKTITTVNFISRPILKTD